jgi:hypothetical protein
MDFDRVAETPQMIRRRKAARACANDKNALAGRRRNRHLPSLLVREIAEEAFDGVNADRAIEVIAVAARLARVIADPAVNGGERIVLNEL